MQTAASTSSMVAVFPRPPLIVGLAALITRLPVNANMLHILPILQFLSFPLFSPFQPPTSARLSFRPCRISVSLSVQVSFQFSASTRLSFRPCRISVLLSVQVSFQFSASTRFSSVQFCGPCQSRFCIPVYYQSLTLSLSFFLLCESFPIGITREIFALVGPNHENFPTLYLSLYRCS